MPWAIGRSGSLATSTSGRLASTCTSISINRYDLPYQSAFAEFERSVVRERVRAGLRRAVARSTPLDELGWHPGRRPMAASGKSCRRCWRGSLGPEGELACIHAVHRLDRNECRVWGIAASECRAAWAQCPRGSRPASPAARPGRATPVLGRPTAAPSGRPAPTIPPQPDDLGHRQSGADVLGRATISEHSIPGVDQLRYSLTFRKFRTE